MRESVIEKYLVKRCELIGAKCEKFTSPNRRSVPDRILTFQGLIVFVEVKRPGQKPTAAQLRDHDSRRQNGALVRVVDSLDAVDNLIAFLVRTVGDKNENENGVVGPWELQFRGAQHGA